MALGDISFSGMVKVRGKQAKGWTFSALPVALRMELQGIAQKKGYKSGEELLKMPRNVWKPSVSVSEVAQHHLDRAARLRGALRTALQMRDDPEWTTSVFKQCFRDFQREYGKVGERHFRRLLTRTLERDGGEEDFDNLSIYLDERLTSNVRTHAPALNFSDRVVLDYLARVKAPAKPTVEEAELVWAVVCEELQKRIESGTTEKKARAGLLKLICKSGVRISQNEEALQVQLKRKFRRWVEGGESLLAIKDQRAEKSGWHRAPEISSEDHNRLVALARLRHGGRESAAWRDAQRNGLLSHELTSYYQANPASKSHVPARIRKAITPEVNMLRSLQRGPREHRLKGAFHTRDWTNVAAGDWFQSDDLTPPVYFAKKNPLSGEAELTRGQFLPMIDERTTFILGFVLISAKHYDSLRIRSLITRVCSEHGLPGKGFSFEHGIWERSKILTGSKGGVPWEIADKGLRGLGLTFRHADLPRGKVIERSLGQLQDLMEDMPGYVGRNEITDKFERVQRQKLDVQAGRESAEKHFLNEEDITEYYQRLVEEYNATPQQGHKLNGLSPAEGWLQFQGNPRITMDDRCLHLLAHDCRKLKIGRNGLTLMIGKNRFNYKDRETGSRVGQTVLAWFNPERPDLLPCTDLNQSEVFSVQRSYDLPAAGDATREQLAAENALIREHNGYATERYRVIKNSLPPRFFRRNLVDQNTARVGAEFTTQRKRITEENDEAVDVGSRISKLSRDLGISSSAVTHSRETITAMEDLQRMFEAHKEDA